MCTSTPDVPTVPERQSTKLPDGGSTANRTDQVSRRRRAMMASILTSPLGAPGTATVTKLGG